jgi:hypothetical protein
MQPEVEEKERHDNDPMEEFIQYWNAQDDTSHGVTHNASELLLRSLPHAVVRFYATLTGLIPSEYEIPDWLLSFGPPHDPFGDLTGMTVRASVSIETFWHCVSVLKNFLHSPTIVAWDGFSLVKLSGNHYHFFRGDEPGLYPPHYRLAIIPSLKGISHGYDCDHGDRRYGYMYRHTVWELDGSYSDSDAGAILCLDCYGQLREEFGALQKTTISLECAYRRAGTLFHTVVQGEVDYHFGASGTIRWRSSFYFFSPATMCKLG